jgi:hypothetical protein
MQVLLSIRGLLLEPKPDDGIVPALEEVRGGELRMHMLLDSLLKGCNTNVNSIVMQICQRDRARYDATAREWTLLYAT